MMTTTTYSFRAEEERMQASDERSAERSRREILAWNALQPIKQPQLRETAYDALEPEINDGDITPGWFQVGHYIVGVTSRDGLAVAVHELTAEERGLIGLEGVVQAPGDLGAQGGFSWPECIGNAQCRVKFVGDRLSVSITVV